VQAPFPVDVIEHSIHKTYLDSTGRPRVTIKKALASEFNEQNIYVRIQVSFGEAWSMSPTADIAPAKQITYDYPFYASFQKPAVVALASLLSFGIYWIVKRMDMRIASANVVKTKSD
jgi:hypothetical protein